MEVFKGRTDLYAKRWTSNKTGKSGYSPVCKNEFSTYKCDKPRVKCNECPFRELTPLTEDIILKHLKGEITIGIYPLLPGDLCNFLAIDFDKKTFEKDVAAFWNICDELDIYANDLFDSSNNKIVNKEKSKNPFKTNTLYIYYNAYFPSQKRYGKGKFKIIIHEKYDTCLADLVDYKTNKIYLSGHIYSDETIAVFVLENYKPNNPRLEITQIILNIFDSSRNKFYGTLSCTNGDYIPSIRKCIRYMRYFN